MAKTIVLSKLDRNFETPSGLDRDDLRFHDVNCPPFDVYGIKYESESTGYRRLPKAVAEGTNQSVKTLSYCTAGGRVRFSTDSSSIAIKCVYNTAGRMGHMANLSAIGFDLYEKTNGAYEYRASFIPPVDSCDGYCSVIELDGSKMRDLTLDLPLFAGIKSLYIGTKDDSVLCDGGQYKSKKPVVFYGSSITHGACASRPGTAYVNILSRRFDTDILCLGFSGAALGEDAITEYISGLEMSVFVLDYDFNAPTAEHLEKTHYKAYKKVRERQPSLPIVMASRPNFDNPAFDGKRRRDIIFKTYETALSEGDTHVFFIDGEKEFSTFYIDGRTVDGTHPNDVGFEIMADKFGAVLQKILK